MKILFLHGWQSVPGGVKPTYLKDHGHEVLNPKLPDDDFDEAVRIAQDEFDRHRPSVVVGSSRGGAVAMSLESGNVTGVLFVDGDYHAWGDETDGTLVRPGRWRFRYLNLMNSKRRTNISSTLVFLGGS
jgi:hypothetical protein